MKPSSKPAAGSSSSSGTTLKYELLTFRSAQPSQPIRFEFGPGKEVFTLDIPTDPNDGTTRQQSWREWKRRAIEHAVVRQHFKPLSALYYGEFALRLPGGLGGGEWIGPESLRDDEEADNKNLLKFAGASSSTSAILLLYAPHIHLCTFDGIKFSASCFGHWLAASDSKTFERVKTIEHNDSVCPNDWLLTEKHQSDLARLLYRIALFMKDDLGLGPEAYIVSVPFGDYVFANGDVLGKEEVSARVQVTDARIFWTLLLKFEEKLNDEDRSKRLDYFVHQRQAWSDARSLDYKKWAAQEAASVRAALDTLTPPLTNLTQFKLPKNCAWDEYGRMQLCLKMQAPICDMVGQMGAISVKLKTVVAAVQMTAQLTGSSAPNRPVSINVSARADQCLVLLPADRYMNVLTRANADPKAWGAALLDALRDAPDRLYSGLLNETSGLYQCGKEDLSKIDECLRSLAPRPPGYKGLVKMVDTSALPLSADIIRSIESKNHTDKRLFLERALENKAGYAASLGITVLPEKPAIAPTHQPTIWEKKRAAAAPPMQQVASTMPRDIPAPSLSANPDREDMSMRQPQTDDFARFDGDALKPPTIAPVIPAVMKPVVRQPLAPGERPPPPMVAPLLEKPAERPVGNGPSFVVPQQRAPPRVIQVDGEQDQNKVPLREPPPSIFGSTKAGADKAPPPQVNQGPPMVIPAKRLDAIPVYPVNGNNQGAIVYQANGNNPAMPVQNQFAANPRPQFQPMQNQGGYNNGNRRYFVPGQQPRGAPMNNAPADQEWRGKAPPPSVFPNNDGFAQTPSPAISPAPRESVVNVKANESQNMDREDRSYDTAPSVPIQQGNFRGNRNFRGRGGRGRGGYVNRGGRQYQNYDNRGANNNGEGHQSQEGHEQHYEVGAMNEH